MKLRIKALLRLATDAGGGARSPKRDVSKSTCLLPERGAHLSPTRDAAVSKINATFSAKASRSGGAERIADEWCANEEVSLRTVSGSRGL